MAASFDVWPTPIAEEDLKGLPKGIRQDADDKRQELESQGCKAAGYRLQGLGVEHICAVRLGDRWRMITAFPAEDQVVVLLIGEHRLAASDRRPNNDSTDAELDVYASLFRGLGLTDWPVGDLEHPQPCCTDDNSPVDAGLVATFIAQAAALRSRHRGQIRRQNRRSQRR